MIIIYEILIIGIRMNCFYMTIIYLKFIIDSTENRNYCICSACSRTNNLIFIVDFIMIHSINYIF